MTESPFPFEADTRHKLLKLTDDLPTIWEILRGQGFRMFDLVVSQVEQMRTRPSHEKHYVEYFQEALKEQLGFYYSVWSPLTRKEHYGLYRSNYLDCLQTSKDTGEHAFLGKHLDPNYALYATLPLNDNARWMEFVGAYQAEKRIEAEELADQIRALSSKQCKATPTRIDRLLKDVLEPLGFATVLRDVKLGRLVYRRIIDQDLALYCEYDDHHGMRAGRSWNLAFAMQPPEAPLWERFKYRNVPLVLGIDSFIPGGYWYSKHGGEWNLIVLGCLINARLLGLLIDRLANDHQDSGDFES